MNKIGHLYIISIFGKYYDQKHNNNNYNLLKFIKIGVISLVMSCTSPHTIDVKDNIGIKLIIIILYELEYPKH